ncbi:hypothetical protein CsSME_00010432 [Camellia sinensis var. sinensis]
MKNSGGRTTCQEIKVGLALVPQLHSQTALLLHIYLVSQLRVPSTQPLPVFLFPKHQPLLLQALEHQALMGLFHQFLHHHLSQILLASHLQIPSRPQTLPTRLLLRHQPLALLFLKHQLLQHSVHHPFRHLHVIVGLDHYLHVVYLEQLQPLDLGPIPLNLLLVHQAHLYLDHLLLSLVLVFHSLQTLLGQHRPNLYLEHCQPLYSQQITLRLLLEHPTHLSHQDLVQYQ